MHTHHHSLCLMVLVGRMVARMVSLHELGTGPHPHPPRLLLPV